MDTNGRVGRRCCLAGLLLALTGCAGLPGSDPLRVGLVGLESLPGEALEVRMAVKLRLQNPNEAPVHYDGVSLVVELRGLEFATGVSDAQGIVPRFGESVIVVPVTVTPYAMARQVYSFAMGDRSKLDFVARGRLGGSGFGGMRFESSGEFALPSGLSARPPASAPPN